MKKLKMKLIVKSVNEVTTQSPPEESHVIVSIFTPGRTDKFADLKPITNNHTKKLIRLGFHDLDRMPKKGSAAEEVFGPIVLFNKNMADEIIKITKNVEIVIVHCDAGQSRSPAVAAALSKFYNGDDSIYFSSGSMYGLPRYTPNMLVYKILLERLHEKQGNS